MSEAPLYGRPGNLLCLEQSRPQAQGGVRNVRLPLPFPSEEGTHQNVLGSFAGKPRLESGLGCLICAIFARQWWVFQFGFMVGLVTCQPGSEPSPGERKLSQSRASAPAPSRSPLSPCRTSASGRRLLRIEPDMATIYLFVCLRTRYTLQ